jgi:hypothetical protein
MSVQVLEEINVFTPLGIRFWDGVQDRAVVSGLNVVCWPEVRPRQTSTASRTRSDVYTFRWLPGMRPVEHLYPDETLFDASAPDRRVFVVSVNDVTERFLPAAFRVSLPLNYTGVYRFGEDLGSPIASAPGVPLFSSSTRRRSERLTAVRGTLVDSMTGQPAAWARLRVATPTGRVVHGLADSRGRFSVMFPYPPLAEGFAGSPASLGAGSPLGDRGWDIVLSVNYEPTVLGTLPGTSVPDFTSILLQRGGGIWAQPPTPSDMPTSELPLHLPYGQELTVRTQGDDIHVLYVSAAASP